MSNGKVQRYVDFASWSQSDNYLNAKDAIVVMVVSLDSNWKILTVYFLINGIDSQTNARIFTTGFQMLHDVGVKLTLDRPSQPFSTTNLLGAT